MPDVMIVILFGLIGFLSSIIFTAIIYRRSQRELSLLHIKIENADRDLSEDIKAIGVNELQLTEAGREILGLRNVTVGRGIPMRSATISRETSTTNYSKSEARLSFLPFFGSIPAGDPAIVDNHPDMVAVDTLELAGRLYKVFGLKMEKEVRMRPSSRYFLVKADGYSMNIAEPVNIEDEDYVLLRNTQEAKNNDIVAAVVFAQDGFEAATLKRYHVENGNVVLKSESDRMKMEIPVLGKDYIQGVAVAILKPV